MKTKCAEETWGGSYGQAAPPGMGKIKGKLKFRNPFSPKSGKVKTIDLAGDRGETNFIRPFLLPGPPEGHPARLIVIAGLLI